MADHEIKRNPITRRAVLAGGGAIAAAGVTAASCKYGTQLFLLKGTPKAESVQPEWSDSRVVKYRPLGRTGFEMSDISFGCSGLSDPAVARRAVERGINYFDTSPDYSDNASERALGEGSAESPLESYDVAHLLVRAVLGTVGLVESDCGQIPGFGLVQIKRGPTKGLVGPHPQTDVVVAVDIVAPSWCIDPQPGQEVGSFPVPARTIEGLTCRGHPPPECR